MKKRGALFFTWAAPLPSRQALPEGPSTVFWAEKKKGK